MMDRLEPEALKYLIGKLTEYGNEVGKDHGTALEGLISLANALATGGIEGRYRFALPCGMGKTTGVRAFIRTIHALGLPLRVSVACSKVEQLCDLKALLIEEDGVAEEAVGLLHSYQHDPEKAALSRPGYASLPSEGHDRQFLLVTHARVRVNDQGAARAWLQGREEDLLFFDESLVVGEALTLPLIDETGDSLTAECAAFEATMLANERHAPAARWFRSVVDLLVDAVCDCGPKDVKTVALPKVTEEVAAAFQRLRPFAVQRFKWLEALLEQARDGVEFRVFKNGASQALVSYSISVPDSLRRVIVLDASDPIRELVHHDYRMMRAEDVVPCLKPFRDREGGLSSLKRYDRVTIYYAKEASGRGAMKDAFGRNGNGPLVQKFIRLMHERPDDHTLAFTFKQRGSGPDYAVELVKALKKAGIDPTANFDHKEGIGRVNVLTWGMETATSDYKGCNVVALLGVLFQDRASVAGAYLGQVDNLKAPSMSDLVTRLWYGESIHAIYQAMNRGAMRQVDVIDGVSQAKETAVYLWHSDPETREKLSVALPGATWLAWREPGETMSASDVALLIAQRLKELEAGGVSKVSSRSLKKEVAPTIPKKTWQRARNEAVAMAPWTTEGSSLVSLGFKPRA